MKLTAENADLIESEALDKLKRKMQPGTPEDIISIRTSTVQNRDRSRVATKQ